MIRRILGLATAAALLSSCDSTQPPFGCPVQSLEWSAVYIPKGASSCPAFPGERLGIQKFSTAAGDEQFSINPQSLVSLNERAPTPVSYSIGPLAKQSDAEGFCSATLAVATKNVPASGGEPAVNRSYRWSNVRILAIAKAPGTQMVADLERTENGCTAAYEVWSMWPGDVSCETDADCASELTINPDFAVTCQSIFIDKKEDPSTGEPAEEFGKRCVPAKSPKSLK